MNKLKEIFKTNCNAGLYVFVGVAVIASILIWSYPVDLTSDTQPLIFTLLRPSFFYLLWKFTIAPLVAVGLYYDDRLSLYYFFFALAQIIYFYILACVIGYVVEMWEQKK